MRRGGITLCACVMLACSSVGRARGPSASYRVAVPHSALVSDWALAPTTGPSAAALSAPLSAPGTVVRDDWNSSTEGSIPWEPVLLVTRGRSTLYSSNLYTCWSRLQNHKDDPHKPFWPLDWRDVLGFAFAAASLFIAAGGGIGGGGILVPLFILVLGFPTNTAVALSNITIVGGAISNFAFNVPRRHTHFDRPLIDWDLILVMEPATILGALLGGYLNKATPNWMTTILLAALLTALTWKLATRAVTTWRKESAALQKDTGELEQPLLRQAGGSPDDSAGRIPTHQEILNNAFRSRSAESPLKPSQPIDVGAGGGPGGAEGLGLSYSPLAYANLSSDGADGLLIASGPGSFRSRSLNRRISLSERASLRAAALARISSVNSFHDGSGHGPARRISEEHQESGVEGQPLAEAAHPPQTEQDRAIDAEVLAILTDGTTDRQPQVPVLKLGLLVLMFAGVVASDLAKEQTRCGSWQYWGIVLSIVPVVLVITLAVRWHLIRQYHAKLKSNYVWTEGDVEWSERNTVLYPLICSLAGLVAGMFGVGGGIVKGPLMLEMGILPDVAAATSATMIMFTAASASVVYLSFGGIPFDYGLATFLSGLLWTILGQVACFWLMKHLNRRSIIVIAMALLMLISMVIIYYEAVESTLDSIKDRRLFDFGDICAGVGKT